MTVVGLSDLPPATSTGWPWDEESPTISGDLPLISVVMPSLNQVSWLEAAIRSVLLQKYPSLELIVVDGGSTDGSIEVLRRYERWLTWTSGPDGGHYDAVNQGFARSSGTVMGWLNSSDMLLPGGLETVGGAFAADPSLRWLTSGVPGNYHPDGILRFPPRGRYGVRFRQPWIQKGWYEGRLLGWIQQESTYWTRSLWNEADGRLDDAFPLSADWDLWRRFARLAPLKAVDEPIGAFRVHEGQKTEILDAYYREIDEVRGAGPFWARPRNGPLKTVHAQVIAAYARATT